MLSFCHYLIVIRPIFRSFFYTIAALWVVGQIAGGGIVYRTGMETFMLAAIALSAVNHFVRPFLNILLLPINLMTLGLFRWIANVLLLYGVTIIVPGFMINAFSFSGLASSAINIPPVYLTGFMAFLAVSFLLSFITSFLYWLSK